MKLRPRQEIFVDRCMDALRKHDNSLGVAPTGAGKTLMMSEIISRYNHDKIPALVIQHSDELVAQNSKKLPLVAGRHISTTIVNADAKNWRGDVVYGMVQTMCRPDNLQHMPRFGLIVIDEAHHTPAASYQAVLKQAFDINPEAHLLGVTATPDRADGRGLRKNYSNIGDQIGLRELIDEGYLVMPVAFSVELGIGQELAALPLSDTPQKMERAAAIMNKQVNNRRAVEEWQRVAGDRKTVLFCSTVAHAHDMAQEYEKIGVRVWVITADTPKEVRDHMLATFERYDSEVRVLLNVAVLIEGWDCQTVSCIVLARPKSHNTTMTQMIGRGLRIVDPELHPGVIKKDCIVIDLGNSLNDNDLFARAVLDDADPGLSKNSAPIKICPDCEGEVPASVMECGLCGYRWPRLISEANDTDKFTLTEIDIMNRSPFKWESMWEDKVTVATAFNAFAACICFNGDWHAIGGSKESGVKHLLCGSRIMAIAVCDDWLRDKGDKDAKKTKRWLGEPATAKQLHMLGIPPFEGLGVTKYRAACLTSFRWSEMVIRKILYDYYDGKIIAVQPGYNVQPG